MTTTATPNDTVAANSQPAVPSLDSIAEKMTAMRNQIQATRQTATGSSEQAEAEAPVAPETEQSVEPEVDSPELEYVESTDEEPALDAVAPEEAAADEVSDPDADTTAQEIIDFMEFAETNPNAKFKFMKNGKEMIIDAKKAASILGQGGAIHEEARQLKIEKAEFEEYSKELRAKQEGMLLAMEFTVQPKLQGAYDEIIKTQGYQTVFQQQLAQTQDPGERARIAASIQQNERYISQQTELIRGLKPAVDQFYEHRRQQVQSVLESNRRAFRDKELKNEYVYNELREKVSKGWAGAQGEIVPGVKNIDLVSSDEYLLGLVRDGLKFRDRPSQKQAGASVAALTTRKGTQPQNRSANDDINKLREQARGGDKKAADNLLMAQLSKLRAQRK
ncbi:hypothetical protein UFOVP849_28 [uncultured Caudovirales phage]|uniref:Uncharacterized protein n=1 Tax=uncultured Caudovirales phage TaxID=2100421 RepID=A0A6J5P4G0_9CAUD|nr:hypothetical protein UFOVP849_28 [uncultured Caudovirales phage]